VIEAEGVAGLLGINVQDAAEKISRAIGNNFVPFITGKISIIRNSSRSGKN